MGLGCGAAGDAQGGGGGERSVVEGGCRVEKRKSGENEGEEREVGKEGGRERRQGG